jgi:glyoxylase-like metal-dependent hydrolase (beta-lactamase superfamily II)
MPERFTLLADSLYVVIDTCRCYVVVRGTSAIAIDPGDGQWIEHLDEIGVEQLEWVLLTHTHRDQCSGVYRLDRSLTRLAVPHTERHLVEDVESFWRRRQVNFNYNQVADFFSLPRNVQVDQSLHDYETFVWKDLKLDVLPAPGHTPGSIALIGDIAGKRIAFTGDMIESPGKVTQIHDLQYGYADALGARLLSQSASLLLEEQPDLLLPGHGEPIENPGRAILPLIEGLNRLRHEMHDSTEFAWKQGFTRLSEHLLQATTSSCTWYVVLSGDGHAVFIDFGYQSGEPASIPRFGYQGRFLPQRLDVLRDEFGVKQIDAVLVTHYHDDHIVGIPFLQRRFETPVWCLDRVEPILSDPGRFNMPCLMPFPLEVTRTFSDRESVDWRGLTFQWHDMPGQTDLHAGIGFELDGKNYLAVGDSVHVRDGKLALGHIIFANRVDRNNHLKVAERMLELEPDVILNGHFRRGRDTSEPHGDVPVTRQDLEDFLKSAQSLANAIDGLVTDHPDRRCRADWVRIDPYRIPLKENDEAELELIAENLQGAELELELSFVMPEGMSVQPAQVKCQVPIGEWHRSTHRIRIDRQAITASPAILCVDVVLDGNPMGWIAECQVWLDGVAL